MVPIPASPDLPIARQLKPRRRSASIQTGSRSLRRGRPSALGGCLVCCSFSRGAFARSQSAWTWRMAYTLSSRVFEITNQLSPRFRSPSMARGSRSTFFSLFANDGMKTSCYSHESHATTGQAVTFTLQPTPISLTTRPKISAAIHHSSELKPYPVGRLLAFYDSGLLRQHSALRRPMRF
jgi:hypothetical protein